MGGGLLRAGLASLIILASSVHPAERPEPPAAESGSDTPVAARSASPKPDSSLDEAPPGNSQQTRLGLWAARVKKAIDREWLSARVPDSLQHRWTKVEFMVFKDGSVIRASLPPGATDDVFSRLALESARKVRQVPPIPLGFPRDTINVVFEFRPPKMTAR